MFWAFQWWFRIENRSIIKEVTKTFVIFGTFCFCQTMGGALIRVVPLLRLCKGVLGSGENGVKTFREQGAWDQKDQGAGSKGKYFREQGAEDSGHFTKLFHIIITIFLRLASLGWFPAIYFAFPPVVNHLFWPIHCHWYQINIPLIQGANERNFREQGDCKNDLGSTQN